jgi:hypothetical protein
MDPLTCCGCETQFRDLSALTRHNAQKRDCLLQKLALLASPANLPSDVDADESNEPPHEFPNIQDSPPEDNETRLRNDSTDNEQRVDSNVDGASDGAQESHQDPQANAILRLCRSKRRKRPPHLDYLDDNPLVLKANQAFWYLHSLSLQGCCLISNCRSLLAHVDAAFMSDDECCTRPSQAICTTLCDNPSSSNNSHCGSETFACTGNL